MPADSEFARLELTRGRQLQVSKEVAAWFASPEDVILNKLRYYQLGESEKHLRDIASILKIQGAAIDRPYVDEWSVKLGVAEEWRLVLERIERV